MRFCFPFDPALADVRALGRRRGGAIAPAAEQEIEEHYACDAAGVVTVAIRNTDSHYGREYQAGALEREDRGGAALGAQARAQSITERQCMFYLFHVFRSFFRCSIRSASAPATSSSCFVAAMLVLLMLARDPASIPAARKLAEKTAWSHARSGRADVALRLALLARARRSHLQRRRRHQLPPARRYSCRTSAWPTHASVLPLLRDPISSCSSPPTARFSRMGQGIALALGRAIFGHPWAGVLLSEAAFCALCYWMLRGWVRRVGSGGRIPRGVRVRPADYWMNSYWGGAVSAIAGCLVFGALPRLREQGRPRDACCWAAGLRNPTPNPPLRSRLPLMRSPSFRKWGRLPTGGRLLIRPACSYRHSSPGSNASPKQSRNQNLDHPPLPTQPGTIRSPNHLHGPAQPNSAARINLRTTARLPVANPSRTIEKPAILCEKPCGENPQHTLLPPAAAYAALPALLLCFRDKRTLAAIGAILLLTAAVTLYPYFYPHYIAAVTCLFVLLSVRALQRLPRPVSALILMLAAAHFIFWYGVQSLADPQIYAALTPYESWDFINRGDPEGRIRIKIS